jgi:hypothetical protein
MVFGNRELDPSDKRTTRLCFRETALLDQYHAFSAVNGFGKFWEQCRLLVAVLIDSVYGDSSATIVRPRLRTFASIIASSQRGSKSL